ncbi:hypothetical protein [Chromobacterium haemolyticum]|uniref:hypothetical protein n=1 Tax=Chromobacterium haemolyticum TaxID=394935 RepID=UPI00307DBF77
MFLFAEMPEFAITQQAPFLCEMVEVDFAVCELALLLGRDLRKAAAIFLQQGHVMVLAVGFELDVVTTIFEMKYRQVYS